MATMTRTINGASYKVHADKRDDKAVENFIASEEALASIGIRLDSYRASTIPGRQGKMSAAMQAQNHKNGLSSNGRRALKAREEQARIKAKKL